MCVVLWDLSLSLVLVIDDFAAVWFILLGTLGKLDDGSRNQSTLGGCWHLFIGLNEVNEQHRLEQRLGNLRARASSESSNDNLFLMSELETGRVGIGCHTFLSPGSVVESKAPKKIVGLGQELRTDAPMEMHFSCYNFLSMLINTRARSIEIQKLGNISSGYGTTRQNQTRHPSQRHCRRLASRKAARIAGPSKQSATIGVFFLDQRLANTYAVHGMFQCGTQPRAIRSRRKARNGGSTHFSLGQADFVQPKPDTDGKERPTTWG